MGVDKGELGKRLPRRALLPGHGRVSDGDACHHLAVGRQLENGLRPVVVQKAHHHAPKPQLVSLQAQVLDGKTQVATFDLTRNIIRHYFARPTMMASSAETKSAVR